MTSIQSHRTVPSTTPLITSFSNISSTSNSTTITLPATPKLALVIRIKGVVGVAPTKRAILKNLRLDRLFTATLVNLNSSTLSMLNKVENYIAWGYINKETLSNLIFKRGFLRVDGNRIPLQNDKQVEIVFEKEGIKSRNE